MSTVLHFCGGAGAAPLVVTALVAGGVGLSPAPAASTSSLTAGNRIVTGDQTILRAIARGAEDRGLLGRDAETSDEVDEWLEAAAVNPDAALTAVNTVFITRTYAAGFALSLADIVLYCLVRGKAEELVGPLGPGGGAAAAPAPVHARAAAAAAPASSSSSSKAAAPAAVAAVGTSAAKKEGKPAAAAAADKAATAAGGKAAANGGGSGEAKKDKGDPTRAAAAAAAKAEKLAAAAAAGAEAVDAKNIGGGGTTGCLPRLAGGVDGGVVTRFPPEPSGYLHIGHVKALLLNDAYAKAYHGRMLVRFDDTNPSKEKEEYEENILEDLHRLGVTFASVSHTSDYFDVIEAHARRLIAEGKAFMDDTPREEMQRERMARVDSRHRDTSAADNAARFDAMLTGSAEGARWCLRARMNMQDDNGTCRDPVLYRCNDTPHHRTGTRYRAYPTYDLACPIVDSLEGVTHALRSSEYHDRDEQFYRLQDMLGVRRVVIQDFARLNFLYTLLSKRKLTWFVDNGLVEGWADPRFPTVQGVLRRGVTLPALREFILAQGASKRPTEMEWDKFWATNKKYVDPVAPRYTALPARGLVLVELTGAGVPAAPGGEHRTQPLHPKNADVGVKAVLYTSRLLWDAADAAEVAEGEEVTLMKWGNAFVRKIERDAAGVPVRIRAELHLAGDVKATAKKLTWLPDSPDNVAFTLAEFDYLIKVPALDEGDDFLAAINPVTKLETPLLGEPAMRVLRAGDIVQVERRGFVRCDRAHVAADRPGVLFLVPDGKTKGLVGLADRPGAVPAALPAGAAAAVAK